MGLSGQSMPQLVRDARAILLTRHAVYGALAGAGLAAWLVLGDPSDSVAVGVSAAFALIALAGGEFAVAWHYDELVEQRHGRRRYKGLPEQRRRRMKATRRRGTLRVIAGAAATAFAVRSLLSVDASPAFVALGGLAVSLKTLETIATEKLAEVRLELSYRHWLQSPGLADLEEEQSRVGNAIGVVRGTAGLALGAAGVAVLWTSPVLAIAAGALGLLLFGSSIRAGRADAGLYDWF